MTSSTGSRLFGVARGCQRREGQDVVAGLRLRLGGDGQQVLVALRGDVVDLDVDLVLVGPFLAQSLGGVVAAGHPVVPEADRQLAGRMRGAHERRGNHRRRCRSRRRNELPAGHLCFLHQASSFFISFCFSLRGFASRGGPRETLTRAVQSLSCARRDARRASSNQSDSRGSGFERRAQPGGCSKSAMLGVFSDFRVASLAPGRSPAEFFFLIAARSAKRFAHLTAGRGVVSRSPGIPMAK